MTASTRLRASVTRLGRWRRALAAMNGSERRALAVAVVLNPVLRRKLQRDGAVATAAFVHRHSEQQYFARRRAVDEVSLRAAKRIGAAVNRAAADPAPTVTCLARSFTALLLLRRSGLPVELRIGVRPRGDDDPDDADRLLFHAWVELGEVPVNDVLDVADRHAVFPLDGLESFLRVRR